MSLLGHPASRHNQESVPGPEDDDWGTPPPLPPVRTPARASARGPVVRHAVGRFMAWSLAMMLVLTMGTVLLARAVGEAETLRDAKRSGVAIAQYVVSPLITDGLFAQDPKAIAALDAVMRTRVQDGTIFKIKVWDESGRVLWSDDHRILNQRYPIDEDDRELFGTTDATASISDLSKDENKFEQGVGPLVEVYAGMKDAKGRNLLFEAYLPTRPIEEKVSALLWELIPITLGALLLFQLSVLPLALSLARRVDRTQAEQKRLLQHSVVAADLERRRIAQDLHDGVVQDLAGLGYALSAVERQLPEGNPARKPLENAYTIVHRDVVALRAMLTDIYPKDLSNGALVGAVQELLDQLTLVGTNGIVRAPERLMLPGQTAVLTYRVIREAVRNIARHAKAGEATVDIAHDGECVTVRVRDNGVGFDSEARLDAAADAGHLGLRLVIDTVADVGGRVTVRSTPGNGTTVEATIPTTD